MGHGEIVALCLFFVFVLSPAVMGFVAYKDKKLKLQSDLAMRGGPEMEAQLAQALAEIAQLRQRMAVLERVVTDDDRKLAQEISRLSAHDIPAAR